MNVDQYMVELGIAARAASSVMAAAPTAVRNHALLAVHDALDDARTRLAEANDKDLERGRANALEAPLMDRLKLTPTHIDTMLEGLRQVAALPDPVGSISDMRSMPSGIKVGQDDLAADRVPAAGLPGLPGLAARARCRQGR